MIKRLAIILLVMWIVFSTCGVSLADSGYIYDYEGWMVATGDVNIRIAPDINAKVIGWYPEGTTVYPLNYYYTRDGRTWVQILYNGQYAYISDKYLERLDTDWLVYNTSIRMRITGSRVNVREQPDIDSDVLAVYRKNVEVDAWTFYCSDDGRIWAEVELEDGTRGYISMLYLQAIDKMPELATSMMISGRTVNVREYPDINSEILEVLGRGTVLDIAYFIPTEDGRIWAACYKDDAYVGFVSVLYLQVIK